MLIIIDMQIGFPSHKPALPGVLARINKAKLEGRTIVIVEFCDWGPTHPDIMDKVRTYGYVLVHKDQDDGSMEVVDALRGTALPETVEVCGVNICWCVRSTVRGLAEEGIRSITHPEAVNCNCDGRTKHACLRNLMVHAEVLA